jgi:hypothetical protein
VAEKGPWTVTTLLVKIPKFGRGGGQEPSDAPVLDLHRGRDAPDERPASVRDSEVQE